MGEENKTTARGAEPLEFRNRKHGRMCNGKIRIVGMFRNCHCGASALRVRVAYQPSPNCY